jgi:hypothetical protein
VYRHPADFGADAARIARWHLARGDVDGALVGLHPLETLEPAARHLLARLRARAGDWEAAVSIWQAMGQTGDQAAHEALAKYFEHRARDPVRALHHARRSRPGQEHDRRILRILSKIRTTSPVEAAKQGSELVS